MRNCSQFMSNRSKTEAETELMDTLSDALEGIRFKGTIYSLTEFTAPWGIQMPADKSHVGFFMLLRGNCVVSFEGMKEPIYLSGGDLILSPRGVGCGIRDSLESDLVPLFEIRDRPPCRGETFKYGGGGPLTSLMMGCFEFDAHGKNPLIEGLPGVIHLKSEHLQSEPWLETSLRLLASETTQNRPGSDLLISRLTDIVFVQSIRAFMSQIKNCNETTGWFKALSDKEIGSALHLIHDKPEAPWTVASLASAVGMSRTSFATKFTSLVTDSPIDYLTSWRMQKALRLMENGEDNLCTIASAVGYTSEAAFSKAFKREMGSAPGGFRKKLIS